MNDYLQDIDDDLQRFESFRQYCGNADLIADLEKRKPRRVYGHGVRELYDFFPYQTSGVIRCDIEFIDSANNYYHLRGVTLNHIEFTEV